jgi:hypothetical protein
MIRLIEAEQSLSQDGMQRMLSGYQDLVSSQPISPKSLSKQSISTQRLSLVRKFGDGTSQSHDSMGQELR